MSNASIALTHEERAEFKVLFDRRLDRVKRKTADVFAFHRDAPVPFMVNSAFYHLFGQDMTRVPGDYLTDPAVMTSFQERTYYEQVKGIDDDFVPCLVPWYGSVVLASAFGCRIQTPAGMDPAVDPLFYPVRKPEDVRKLKMPNPENDGLLPAVLRCQRHMRAQSFLPVGITDCQGPLTTANQLMGYDNLIYLMADHPTVMHALMDIVTEALIAWVKKQKEVTGEPLDHCFTDQQVYMGEHGGVWIADDDAILMSPRTYREFVVPYNQRILTAFGGGCIHTCGNTLHQVDNLLATEGLRVFNNYTLHNLGPLAEMKRKLQGRIVIYLCDFTPLDFSPYFTEIIDRLQPGGMVIDSQVSPVLALLSTGQYNPAPRERDVLRADVLACLKSLFPDAA
jgi:hypothetical protein